MVLGSPFLGRIKHLTPRVGITPDVLDQIFTPVHTPKPVGKGSGLGLSIVERIVRAHGGAITATSPGLGRGATFTVTLPVASQRR